MRDACNAATIDAQLEASARAYVAHPRGVKVEDYWMRFAPAERVEAIRGGHHPPLRV